MGLDDLINKLVDIKNAYNLDNKTKVETTIFTSNTDFIDGEITYLDFDTTANDLQIVSTIIKE